MKRKRGLLSQLYFAKRDARKRGLSWYISDKRAMNRYHAVCKLLNSLRSVENGTFSGTDFAALLNDHRQQPDQTVLLGPTAVRQPQRSTAKLLKKNYLCC